MKISFFEEFPTEENLQKLNLINFKTKIYIASNSLNEFRNLESKIKTNKNIEEIIYWPILKHDEGYWLSPFSKRDAILRIIDEVKENNTPLLWDAEFPKNKYLIFTQAFNFFRNKYLIRNFIKNYKNVYITEYYPDQWTLNLFGLHFDPRIYNKKIIKIYYSSMHDFDEDFLKTEFTRYNKKYNDKFLVGLGTIAIGIKGNETILSKELLDRDLSIANKSRLEEVVIFRLGGLNKDYLKVINRYT